jgi:hypothetical protein
MLGLSHIMADWLAALLVGILVSVVGIAALIAGTRALPKTLQPKRSARSLSKDKPRMGEAATTTVMTFPVLSGAAPHSALSTARQLTRRRSRGSSRHRDPLASQMPASGSKRSLLLLENPVTHALALQKRTRPGAFQHRESG